MWPFQKAYSESPDGEGNLAPPRPGRTLQGQIDDLRVEMIELRETLDKTFHAIMKVQGKVTKRAALAERMVEEDHQQELLPSPDVPPNKDALRAAANRLRAMK